MTDPNDPVQRLERAGARPVPPSDPLFTDRLAARLRAAHPGAPAPAPRWHRRRAVPLVLGIAAIALVIALVGVLTRSQGPAGLTLTTATATDVVLPDGTVVDGEAGLSLPEGALVQTGDDGSASAGDVEVDAGSTAVVIDGELVVVGDDRPAPPGVTPTSAASGTTRPPDATSPATTTRPPTTTTMRPPPTTTTTPTPPPARIGLRVAPGRDGGVALRWTSYERADFAKYVVLRIVAGHPTVIAERFAATATNAVDRPPAGAVGYRVLVLDGTGRVVGSSAVVSPSVDASP